ncbi:AraC family transcriptional regulator [Ancrocorticia populi]|uniref:AraC family transcriptional regulator n=2 Tax=Ancrocorticia populi TaxID=2175228 RepID=A0A2V1K3E8_9ACTO|nr:AraC family transcriptional regulator [Ancrocorticia populi]
MVRPLAHVFSLLPAHTGAMGQGRNDEFYYEHLAPSRGIHAWQYVYEIGSYHYNWHPALELLLVLTGEVEVCADGSTSVLGPGDLVLINSGEGHATLAKTPNSVVLLLHLDQSYLAGFTPDGAAQTFACRSTPVTRSDPGFTELRRILAGMMLGTPADSPGAIASYESGLARVVQLLFEHFVVEEAPTLRADTIGRDTALTRATAYIERHHCERITLKQLSEVTGYFPSYVSELFSQTLGMTTSAYIRRVRLAHAVTELSQTGKRISDVAIESGFPEVKSFNAAFHQAFGKTPSQYRQHLRELGDRIQLVDESFHEQFIPRSSERINRVLRSFAQMAGSCPSVCPRPALGPLVEGSIAESIDLAHDLISRLEKLSGVQ